MDLDGSLGDPGDPGIYVHRRRTGDAFVELAAAAALRLAANYLLAGHRTTGPLPDSVRRLGWSWFSSLQYAAAHGRAYAAANGRALGAHDARGARKIPPELALSLRWLCSANQRTQGGRWPGR